MKRIIETQNIVIGKDYSNFMGCEEAQAFTIEPCVGGMVSGVQIKWRVRYRDSFENKEKADKVLIVMNDLAFSISGCMFVIKHKSEKNFDMESYSISSVG